MMNSPMKGERLDHSINDTVKVSLTRAKAGFLPYTLIIKKNSRWIRNMFTKKPIKVLKR